MNSVFLPECRRQVPRKEGDNVRTRRDGMTNTESRSTGTQNVNSDPESQTWSCMELEVVWCTVESRPFRMRIVHGNVDPVDPALPGTLACSRRNPTHHPGLGT
jgi:hypothetical protein